MEQVNILDVEMILAYIADRNAQCAIDINAKMMARITDLIGDSPDFPPIGVMLTNDQSILVGYDPNKPIVEGEVFVYIVNLDSNNKSTGVNAIWGIDLNTGKIADLTANIVTVQ